MDEHLENLKNICRVCCGKLDKGRTCKPVLAFQEILFNYFDVNLERDQLDIHPTLVCEKCRKQLSKVATFLTKKESDKLYKPQLTIHKFQPHNDNCQVCCQKKGRPVLKRVFNQHNITESSYNIQAPIDQSKKDCFVPVSTTVPNNTLDLNTVINHSKDLGYVYIDSGNGFYSFIIFFKNEESMQLQSLVTVNLIKQSSWTWKVLIGQQDVSCNEKFECFQQDWLGTNDAINLLTVCAELNFCVGNEDFQFLCEKRKQGKSNYAIFNNRSNEKVAEEVNDTICKVLKVKNTIRHSRCNLVTSKSERRCSICKDYRPTLVSLQSKVCNTQNCLPMNVPSSSKINNRYLSHRQLASKLEDRKKEVRNLSNENAALKIQIQALINSKGVLLTDTELDQIMKNSLNELQQRATSDFPKGSAMNLLFDEQLKQSQCKDSRQMRWHPIMIRWCLGLYHTSPAAYEFIRRSSFLKLPNKSTLLDYSIYTTPQSGFNPDTLERLYKEADLENLEEYKKNVSLLFDEMKIHSELVYSKSTGKLIGFVEMGDINTELELFERSCLKDKKSERDIATHVLAFMVRGIYTDLQFCFGFFPTKDLSADTLFPCVWEAILVLESLGLIVRCMVSDGASSNRKFFKLHASSPNEVPYFATNICDKSRKIYFICDVPHLIKTVRNNWENSHGNRNSKNLCLDNYQISWNHLVALKEYDTNETTPGLYLSKIRNEHIKLTPSSRMKVNLAAQCLSSTVANAMEFQGKEHTKGTQEFIRKFDKFFDCLNGQHKLQGVCKRKDTLNPYRDVNDPRFKWLKEDFLENYINRWVNQSKTIPNLSATEQKKLRLSSQTIEGLRITVKSTTELIQALLLQYPGFYILSGRFSQDPIEQHFSAQRRRGGGNTNPTVERYGYNELAIHCIQSKNVASLKGNTKVENSKQINWMEDSQIPLKRRKRCSKGIAVGDLALKSCSFKASNNKTDLYKR